MPQSEVQLVCQQLLEGLVKMHNIGILHRDLKPQNIFVVQKSPIWAKIGDFDVSKQIYGNEPPPKTRVGTDGYTAPEILDLLDIETSVYTSSVDIWSLGRVLYCTIFSPDVCLFP